MDFFPLALAISFKLYYNEILLKNVTANGIKTDFSAEIADEGGSRVEPLVYMTPKQPFFVTASESYVKYIMNRFGIVHFYQCRTGKEPRYAVPDGCVDMVFLLQSVPSQRGYLRYGAVSAGGAFGIRQLLFWRAFSAGI